MFAGQHHFSPLIGHLAPGFCAHPVLILFHNGVDRGDRIAVIDRFQETKVVVAQRYRPFLGRLAAYGGGQGERQAAMYESRAKRSRFCVFLIDMKRIKISADSGIEVGICLRKCFCELKGLTHLKLNAVHCITLPFPPLRPWQVCISEGTDIQYR